MFMALFIVDFSLVDWLAYRAIGSVDAVTVPQASQLLMELGLDHYLDTMDRCSLSDTVYGAAGVNGWINGTCNVILFWNHHYSLGISVR